MSADTIFAGPYYLTAPDGTHCYPLRSGRLPNILDPVLLPDGGRLVREDRGSYDQRTTWLVSPGPLTEIRVPRTPERITAGWVLKDPDAASEKYPARLTTVEWEERFGDSDDDDEDYYLARRIYTQEIREEAREPLVYPTADLKPLDGALDSIIGRTWQPDQPWAVIYTANYHHLIPGRMRGVADAVLAALTAEFGTRPALRGSGVADYRNIGKGIQVTVSVPFETPRWTTRPRVGPSGRKLKSVDRVPVNLTAELTIDPGDYVTGATKAEAAETFDRVVSEWVEYVRSYQVTACDHCSGTGVIRTQNSRPETTR